MIKIPGMLMVGARCKSDGKTAFTCALIEKFRLQQDIVGVKITTVDSFNANHHPEIANSESGGTCMGPFYITEEKNATKSTDTGKMLAAGAKRVLWLLSLEAIRFARAQLPGHLPHLRWEPTPAEGVQEISSANRDHLPSERKRLPALQIERLPHRCLVFRQKNRHH